MSHPLTYFQITPARALALGIAAVLGIAASCLAQDDFPKCTFNIGGGGAHAFGKDGASLDTGWNFHTGGGIALPTNTDSHRNWRFYLTANFMLDELRINPEALQHAKTYNPTDIGLLAASSGRAKFFAATLDPTIRVRAGDHATWYFFGGFGWFRRSLEFTGASIEGTLLQPNNPVVFGTGGNSGAYELGGGINFKVSQRLGRMTPYAEARYVHGLAINSATSLVPFSLGVRW